MSPPPLALLACAVFASGAPNRAVRLTIAPETTSTDNWLTRANQTDKPNGSVLSTINQWIRSNPPPLTGFFEVAAQITVTSEFHAWKAPIPGFEGVAGYTADGVHPNRDGYSLIAAARPIRF